MKQLEFVEAPVGLYPFSCRLPFNSKLSKGHHFFSFKTRHLIFKILNHVSYPSNVVFQTELESVIRIAIQGGSKADKEKISWIFLGLNHIDIELNLSLG